MNRKTVFPEGEKQNIGRHITLLILSGLLVFFVLCSFFWGRYPVPPKALFGILFGRIFPLEPFWTTAQEVTVINIRMPRIILALMVGASLSLAGASYQGVFQNPMAAPDILGASAGAGFGAALAIYLGLNSIGITSFAFFVSLLTVALVFFISHYTKGEPVMGLVLSGIIISTLFQSGTSFIKLVADPSNKLPAITYWLMGSLAGASWHDVFFAAVPMLIGALPLFLLRWRLNILMFGDDEARALGLNPGKIRLIIVVCASLLTAASVSVSGIIGWVGLVIPHMMRRLVGSNYRFLTPASVLGGSLFLLIVDDLSRNIYTSEIPIGILTAFIGAPFFILLITRRHDWK